MKSLLKPALYASWREHAAELLQTLQQWPWLDTLITLRQRFREDRLGMAASSLTFTTLIALVPLVTVMLAVFSAFPMFSGFQRALETYFLQALIPDNIAKPVINALTQFAQQSRQLGTAGIVVLLLTAIALMLTIDRALNGIWRVRRPRPLAQRVLVYWAAITLGPLLLGISLTGTSLAISASRGWVGASRVASIIDVLEFVLALIALAGLFHYVPNTWVRWRHALAGALFAAVGLEVAKRLLGWYVAKVPTYAVVYGAFATLPIMLIWIYSAWVIVLLGAVIAAYAPSLQMRVARRPAAPGQSFTLALTLLGMLARARGEAVHGLTLGDMATELRTDPLQIEPVLDALIHLDWVARLDEDGEQRHVLTCEPAATPAAPLIDSLLLSPGSVTVAFRERARLASLTLADLLGV
jgi:membrane protein